MYNLKENKRKKLRKKKKLKWAVLKFFKLGKLNLLIWVFIPYIKEYNKQNKKVIISDILTNKKACKCKVYTSHYKNNLGQSVNWSKLLAV